MGRVYAGILGPLAMAVVICRGWFGSGGVENTLGHGDDLSRDLFCRGALIGQIAQATIDESVRAKLQQQLNHQDTEIAIDVGCQMLDFDTNIQPPRHLERNQHIEKDLDDVRCGGRVGRSRRITWQ